GGPQRPQQTSCCGGGGASEAAAGSCEVRGPLLELLLNLALDPRCHPALADLQVGPRLVRCVAAAAAAQPLRLEPTAAAPAGQGAAVLVPWRAAAALRLIAALAADGRFTAPRPAMQSELAAAGAVEAVADEVQRAAAALSTVGAAVQYELSMTALCALMTGNRGVQRQVAAAPGLLAALAAAPAHPAVMRSNTRLRVTLAAWRMVTAPLADPIAVSDPSVAADLLIGLGHDPGVALSSPGVSGPVDDLYGPGALYVSSSLTGGHRRSILEAAVDAVVGMRSSRLLISEAGEVNGRSGDADVREGGERPSAQQLPSRKSAPVMGRVAANTSEASGSEPDAAAAASPGRSAPHLSVFASPLLDEELEGGGGGSLGSRQTSRTSNSLAAALLRPTPSSQLQLQQQPPCAVPPPLPGELVAVEELAEASSGSCGGSAKRAAARAEAAAASTSSEAAPRQERHLRAPHHDPSSPRQPAAVRQLQEPPGATASLPPFSFPDLSPSNSKELSGTAPATAATISASGAAPTPTSATALAAAAAGSGGGALEMAAPLRNLVTTLQALLPRPGCRAGAALVLAQLARLEVVRGSVLMAAGWGSLMEAVTSSLTGGGAGGAAPVQWCPRSSQPLLTQPSQPLEPPLHSLSGSSEAAAAAAFAADPRDKLALLEAMEVAAGTAAEGRAALTHGSVVTALADLACGRGALAESLLLHEGGPLHSDPHPYTHYHHQDRESHSHYRSLQHHLSRNSRYAQLGHHPQLGSPYASPHHHFSQHPLHPHQHQHHPHYTHHQQHYQHQHQRYLPRARTLAMAILSELVSQPHVAAQLQRDGMGSILADNLLAALTAAVAAAAAPPASSGPSAALSALAWAMEEQQRLRNAAARLLRQLAQHVDCARDTLATPRSVGLLTAALSQLWDVHGPVLAPPSVGPAMPRPTSASIGNRSRGHSSRMLDPSASFLSTRGGDSFRHPATTGGIAHMPSGRGSISAQNSPLPRGVGGSSGNMPSALALTAAGGSSSGTLSASNHGGTSVGVGSNPVSRTVTGLQASSGPRRPSGSGYQTNRVFPLSPHVSQHHTDSPHGVTTRMSLHTAACPDVTQWSTPAQQAMKALELSEERNAAAAAAAGPSSRRHANTHGGYQQQPRVLAASSSHGATASGGAGGTGVRASRTATRGPSRLSAAACAAATAEGTEEEDDTDRLLRGMTPPSLPQLQQEGSLSQQPSPVKSSEATRAVTAGAASSPSAAAGGGSGGGSAGSPAVAAALESTGSFTEFTRRSAPAAAGGGGREGSGGGGGVERPRDGMEAAAAAAAAAAATASDSEGDGGTEQLDLLATDGRRHIARRGTRALAPPARAPAAPAALSGSAAAAAQCLVQLSELLGGLARSDTDAARAMATLPSVELFVDLLAASHPPLVAAVLELLAALAARQDAHETFWDCDVVGQLVAHLQLRSAAAAAAAAAATPPAAGASRASGSVGAAAAAATAAAGGGSSSSGVVQQLQLRAAQVLERLCCDPDLHGRLAATELPAALMAVVRRAAMPEAQHSDYSQTAGGFGGWGAVPSLSFSIYAGPAAAAASPGPQSSLLVCVLSALVALLDCEDVRRQARERRFPLYLGMLASSAGTAGGSSGGAGGGPGGWEPLVSDLAAQCGEKLRDSVMPGPAGGVRFRSGSNSSTSAARAL
ncbi:hypothetical protein Agub_g987, partial [Astrephomene gubernaculifera]